MATIRLSKRMEDMTEAELRSALDNIASKETKLEAIRSKEREAGRAIGKAFDEVTLNHDRLAIEAEIARRDRPLDSKTVASYEEAASRLRLKTRSPEPAASDPIELGPGEVKRPPELEAPPAKETSNSDGSVFTPPVVPESGTATTSSSALLVEPVKPVNDNPIEVHSSKGDHKFLSNFAEDRIVFRGREYRTAEGAYHSWKSGKYVEGFEELSGVKAKSAGRKVDVDKEISAGLMDEIIRSRYEQSDEFRSILDSTSGSKLTHSVGDRFWSKEFPAALERVRDGGRAIGINKDIKSASEIRFDTEGSAFEYIRYNLDGFGAVKRVRGKYRITDPGDPSGIVYRPIESDRFDRDSTASFELRGEESAYVDSARHDVDAERHGHIKRDLDVATSREAADQEFGGRTGVRVERDSPVFDAARKYAENILKLDEETYGSLDERFVPELIAEQAMMDSGMVAPLKGETGPMAEAYRAKLSQTVKVLESMLERARRGEAPPQRPEPRMTWKQRGAAEAKAHEALVKAGLAGEKEALESDGHIAFVGDREILWEDGTDNSRLISAPIASERLGAREYPDGTVRLGRRTGIVRGKYDIEVLGDNPAEGMEYLARELGNDAVARANDHLLEARPWVSTDGIDGARASGVGLGEAQQLELTRWLSRIGIDHGASRRLSKDLSSLDSSTRKMIIRQISLADSELSMSKTDRPIDHYGDKARKLVDRALETSGRDNFELLHRIRNILSAKTRSDTSEGTAAAIRRSRIYTLIDELEAAIRKKLC